MRVLVTFKTPQAENPAAVHQGLGITSLNAVMYLREMRIEADAKGIPNGEYLKEKLATDWKDYTHVIMQAPFIDAPWLSTLFQAFTDKKFAIVYHSNFGFLANDRFAVKSLPEYLKLQELCPNFNVASNQMDMCGAMHDGTGCKMAYLPNLFHMPFQFARQRIPWKNGDTLHVGLFGAARVLKNWLTAGVSTMILSRSLGTKIELHVSASRDEGAAFTRDNLADLIGMNPDVQIVETPWMPYDDFRRVLFGIDLCLQPSFSETFNNVTAEAVSCGVPSVVSDAISWAPRSWKARSDSAREIAATALTLLRDPNAAQDGLNALAKYNDEGFRAWKAWL